MVVHSNWCFVTLVQHSVSTASKLRKIKQSETNCASNFSPHPQAQGLAAHCTLNVTRLCRVCSSPHHMSRVHKTEVDILIDPSIQLTMIWYYCPQSTPIPWVHCGDICVYIPAVHRSASSPRIGVTSETLLFVIITSLLLTVTLQWEKWGPPDRSPVLIWTNRRHF